MARLTDDGCNRLDEKLVMSRSEEWQVKVEINLTKRGRGKCCGRGFSGTCGIHSNIDLEFWLQDKLRLRDNSVHFQQTVVRVDQLSSLIRIRNEKSISYFFMKSVNLIV